MMTRLDLEKDLAESGAKILEQGEVELAEECIFCCLKAKKGQDRGIFSYVVKTDEIRDNYVKTNERYSICECSLGKNDCLFLRMYINLEDHLDMPHLRRT